MLDDRFAGVELLDRAGGVLLDMFLEDHRG
jgi:hypothetical protein